jgi:hypothetical protein
MREVLPVCVLRVSGNQNTKVPWTQSQPPCIASFETLASLAPQDEA